MKLPDLLLHVKVIVFLPVNKCSGERAEDSAIILSFLKLLQFIHLSIKAVRINCNHFKLLVATMFNWYADDSSGNLQF